MTAIGIVLLSSALCLVLERFGALRRLDLALRRRGLDTDLAFLSAGYLLLGAPTLAYVTLGSGALESMLGLHSPIRNLPGWALVLASIVLLDLGGYLSHRLLHASEVLWQFHKVHHSSRTLDWAATFRSHLVEQVVRRVLTPLGLFALGMPAEVIVVASGVVIGWAVLGHANLGVNLRVLEPVFITPRLHHLHHVPELARRNLGTVLSVWDRCFGTLHTRPVASGTVLGVEGSVDDFPQRFVQLLRQPFRDVFWPRRV